MNYLVHLYLSGEDPQRQLGGLMGDFVKGPIPKNYPQKICDGLRLHRRIDSLAHNNQHTRKSRQRIQNKYGHARGIIVDIFYDHLLAADWTAFSEIPLEEYAASIYHLLEQHYSLLPKGLQQIVPRMKEHNWLVSYRHHDVVVKALQRIAQRLSRELPLHQAIEDLARHKELFKADFLAFMTEAENFAEIELNF